MELERTATEAMIDAIRRDDKTLFLLALDNGADVNANNGEPLHLAAEMRRSFFIKELFLREANISAAARTASDIAEQQGKVYQKALGGSREEKEAIIARDKYSDIAHYLTSCRSDMNALLRLRQVKAFENIAAELKELRIAAAEMLEPRNLRKAPSLSLPKIKP